VVGIVARHGTKFVIVTAETLEKAEHIALELFSSVGIELEGMEVTLLVFDPQEAGGIVIDMESDEFEPPSMDGWGPEGFTG
tara:strand:+ start:14129 stop:14371 length:243 start_codon:yes stop_codon:yes gene_type:complete